MGLIRTLLIIILAYFLIRFLDRHVVPFFFGKPKEKSKPTPPPGGKEFRKKTGQGDVTITDFRKKKKKDPDAEGDYVDYEEVKD